MLNIPRSVLRGRGWGRTGGIWLSCRCERRRGREAPEGWGEVLIRAKEAPGGGGLQAGILRSCGIWLCPSAHRWKEGLVGQLSQHPGEPLWGESWPHCPEPPSLVCVPGLDRPGGEAREQDSPGKKKRERERDPRARGRATMPKA